VLAAAVAVALAPVTLAARRPPHTVVARLAAP
jgi:hypothetical protein